MGDSGMFLVAAFGIPILGIILLLVPWKRLMRSMHYPLGPEGIDKEAKAHASNTIYMDYIAGGASREGETLDLDRENNVE